MADLSVCEKGQGMLGDGNQLGNAVTCAIHLDGESRYRKHREKLDEQADLSWNLSQTGGLTMTTTKAVERWRTA